jgi:hypothetical protein
MANWDTSAWIAILALAVSALSFLAAVWAAWVSHRTLQNSQRTHQQELELTFERERGELLAVIGQSRLLLDWTRIRIGTLQVRFDAAPNEVKIMLANYTNLFTEYLPSVEEALRQCNGLIDEISNWDRATGIAALVRHQAHFRTLIHNDQIAHDQGVFLVDVFYEKFGQATQYVAHASRSNA